MSQIDTRTTNYEKPATIVEIENSPDECEVLECVRRLEQREQLFANYIFNCEQSNDLYMRVLDYINQNLNEFFTCPLEALTERRKEVAIIAVHAFYYSEELKQYRCECSKRAKLWGDLLVCYILRDMENHILYQINHESRKAVHKFDQYLLTDYTECNSESQFAFRYIPDAAMIAKCEKVLNHSNSIRFTSERWTPCISIQGYHFLFAFITVIPIWFIKFNKPRPKEGMEEIIDKVYKQLFRSDVYPPISKREKLRIFYSSPCSNFFVHTMFYFSYIFLFAAVLIRKPRFDYDSAFSLNDFHLAIVLYFWRVAYILYVFIYIHFF
ncbi:hypothetical protein PMAYCL1PPCAC_21311 [Pristionchus mayeri]|uniref:Uncharacterized protein n=1 Tax=Pristionchus mayeri TaxID=1317129 RepID=A0AAN5CUX3_9BILA|nr:hypothetical protein PMAYCL1PPCAC_21311 [Pristionchus mayeri]